VQAPKVLHHELRTVRQVVATEKFASNE
jgi:hypothetical protein